MGSTLVMFTVPDEQVGMSPLCIMQDGKVVEVDRKPDRMWVDGRHREQVLREHPDAFFVWRVPYSALWQPPIEPYEKYGGYWFKQPARYRAHSEAVKRSLRAFLNRNLERLDQMMRTGYWVLAKARVVAMSVKPISASPRSRLA